MHRLTVDVLEIKTADDVIYQPSNFFLHPGYVAFFKTNDIALISVSITLNSDVKAATVGFIYLEDNSVCKELSGWNPPQEYTVKTMPLAQCQASYTPISPTFITPDHVCLVQDGDNTYAQTHVRATSWIFYILLIFMKFFFNISRVI